MPDALTLVAEVVVAWLLACVPNAHLPVLLRSLACVTEKVPGQQAHLDVRLQVV